MMTITIAAITIGIAVDNSIHYIYRFKEEFKLAGVLILFNNLLQSLFKSQILTLGLVMIGIFSMFIILFRNIKLSLIGVVPNFIAAFFILGIIGLLVFPWI